ncbi:MAG: signal transduction histidine kinase [Oleispira sp.]|jgi:signal transduction histidine kinase
MVTDNLLRSVLVLSVIVFLLFILHTSVAILFRRYRQARFLIENEKSIISHEFRTPLNGILGS